MERGGYDIQKTAAFVLSRLYQGHRHPESLISSRKEDDAEAAALKAKVQRLIMTAIIALGLGVSCFIGLFALGSYRKQQRLRDLIMSDLSKEGCEEPSPETSGSADIPRIGRAALHGAILLLILLSAFISIALLIDSLSWINP